MTCHGEGTNPAPPRALDGATGTKHRGVGAHQIHLGQSAVTLPVACSACHVVPGAIFDPEHLELDPSVDLTKGPARHAEITFSGRALANGATPTWDGDALTCSGTWCHGDADRASGEGSRPIRGGRFSQPMWTLVNGTQRACDACHGAPPPAPHPQSKKCEGCHATVVGADRVIINRALGTDPNMDNSAQLRGESFLKRAEPVCDRDRGRRKIPAEPLPHHPACGSAPGGSKG